MGSLPKKEKFYSIHEAAKYLGVSTKTMRRWEKSSILTSLRTKGGHRRYSVTDLLETRKNKNVKKNKVFAKDIKNVVKTIAKPKENITFNKSYNEETELTELYKPFELDPRQKRALKIVGLSLFSFLTFFLIKKVPNPNVNIANLTASLPIPGVIKTIAGRQQVSFNTEVAQTQKTEGENNSQVLAAATSANNPSFNVNITSAFNDLANFIKGLTSLDVATGTLEATGAAKLSSTLNVTGLATFANNVDIAGDLTSPSTTFNLLPNNVTTLNIGKASTNTSISSTTGTTTVNNDLNAKGVLNVSGKITGSGDLSVSGASALSGAITGSSSLTVSGATTLSSTLAVTGNSTFGNITKINGITYSFPTTQGSSNSTLTNDGTGTLTWASSSGTGTQGFWTRTGTTLTPSNSGDAVTISGLLTGSAGLTISGAAANINSSGTSNTIIGNTTGTFSLTSSGGLNVTTAGALTGVASLDTITTSATALTFAGAGSILSTGANAITVDSNTSGNVNIGTGTTAKTINIGTGVTGNTINLGTAGTTTISLLGLSASTGNALCLDASNHIVTCTVGTGGIAGSGTSGQIAFFNGANNITSETSGFGWDTSTKKLTVTSTATSGNAVAFTDNSLNTTNANLANLTFTNAAASGSVTTNGVNISATGTASTGTNTNNLINLSVTAGASNNTFNGINFGSNLSNYINSTNLVITSAGAETLNSSMTSVGVNSQSGLIQGTGGITVTGTANINNSGSAATNLGTGTGNVSLGNTSGTLLISSLGGLNVTTGGNITAGTYNGDTLSSTALTFSGAAPTISPSTSNTSLTVNANGSGTLNLANGGTASTINIGTGITGNTINLGTAGTTTISLQGISSGTGNAMCLDVSNHIVTCTVGSGGVAGSGTSGQIAFFNGAGSITSETSGFGWDTTNKLFTVTSNNATGSIISATASAITTGNIVKLGQGGNTNFSGNVIFGDIDNTGQGGIGFTGNFLRFDNAGTTKFKVDSSGNTLIAAGSKIDTIAAGTLNIGTSTATQINIGVSTANTSLTLGSDATGDVFYRNSSGNLTRLGIGGAGQVLTVSSGLPSWTGGVGGTGSSGFWTRSAGGVLSPQNTADTVNLTPNTTTGTGSSAGFNLQANSLTTGNGVDFSSSSLTTGNLVKLASTSTAGNAETGLNIAISGTNGTSSVTNYGLQSAITNTGTSSTNIAGYFNATGATTNYDAYLNSISTANTNNYGLFIGSISGATNNYGIFFNNAPGTGSIISAAATDINIKTGTTGNLTLDSGTTGNVNLGNGSNAKTITIGNSTGATAINLTSGTGSQSFTSSVTTGTLTSGAFVFNDTTLNSGDLIYATASAITTGNIVKLGQGGNTNFTGNGLFMDFDNTGQGGNGFTGNFLKLNNAGTTYLTIGSNGSFAGTSTAASGTAYSYTDTSLNTTNANLTALSFTNAASSGSITVNGANITATGTVSSGTNTNNLINLSATAGAANNTFNGINFGSNLTNYVNGTNWTVTAAGNETIVGINVTGLSASSGVYTDGSKNLTSTVPTSGALGYWTRSGSNLYATTLTDNIGIGTTSPQQGLTVATGVSFVSNMAVPVLVTPTCSTSGGSLANGTYYYKVEASDGTGFTIPSNEVSCTISGGVGNGSVTVGSWTASPGDYTNSYRIFRGTSSGGENVYFTTGSAGFSDTGAAGTSGTPATATTAYANELNSARFANSWINGGNLGIGTTAPNSPLDVFSTTNPQMRISYDTSNYFTIGVGANGATSLDTNSTGNISLGTNSNAKTITIGNSTGSTQLNFTSGTGAQTFTSSVATGITTSSGMVFNDTALTTGTLTYFTSSNITTGKLFDIATTGNTWTGNGTTNGLINFASTSTAGTGSASNILLNLARSGANTNSSVSSYGIYSNVTNTGTSSTNVGGYFSASGATNNYGLIVNSGFVGIGTTAPTSPLYVATANNLIASFNGPGGGNAYINVSNGTGSGVFGADNNNNVFIDASNTGAALRFLNQSSEKMRLINGNLGIGTTNPGAHFDLEDSTTTTGSIAIASASAITSGNILLLGQGGNTNFTGNGLFMDFDNTGQGGIGFTGDFLKLNNVNSTKFELTSAGNLKSIAGAQWLPESNSAQALQIANNAGTSYVDFDSSNNRVGIGTTNPGFKLTVSGTGTTSGGANDVRVIGTGTFGGGMDFQSTDTGGQTFSIFSTGSAASPGAGYLGFFDVTNGAYRMVINPTGKIGIGTVSPNGLLDVSKAISGTPSTTVGEYLSLSASTFTDNVTAASGTAAGNAFNSIAAPTIVGTNANITETNGYNLYLGGAVISSGNVNLTNTTGLFIDSAAVKPAGTVTNSFGLQVKAQTGATNNYAAAFTGGNLGIGTTSPSAALHVEYGSANSSTTTPALILDNPSGGAQTAMDFRFNNAQKGLIRVDSSNNFVVDSNAGTLFLNYIDLNATPGTIDFTNGKMTLANTGVLTVTNNEIASNTLVINSASLANPSGGTCTQVNGATEAVYKGTTTATSSMIFYNGTRIKHARITSDTACTDGAAATWQQVALTDSITGQAAGDPFDILTPVSNLGNIDTGFFNNVYMINAHTVVADAAGGYDLAEQYPFGDSTLEASDVVSISATQSGTIVKSSRSYDPSTIGVISDRPGFILGSEDDPTMKKVSLAGRVPVKVNLQNGSINSGDPLTSSDTPGVAMKATHEGFIIGRAIENYDGTSGKVLMIAQAGYYNPSVTATVTPSPTASSSADLTNILGSFTASSSGTMANLYQVNTTKLNVLGDTVLSNTVVNGKLNVGSLTFNNTDQSINAIGVLKIQNLALGNIEFMNGLVSIDTNGNLIAKSVTANKYKVAGTSAGTGTITAGQTTTTINSNDVTSSSLIFVTAATGTDKTIAVTAKTTGTSFVVSIPSPDSKDIQFNWWIVDKQ